MVDLSDVASAIDASDSHEDNYSIAINECILALMDEGSGPALEREAREVISAAALPDNASYNCPTAGDDIFKKKLKIDEVLTAMLDCAKTCGGEHGQRYAAAAIYSCTFKGRGTSEVATAKETLEKLQLLGTTWVSHFLLICESVRTDSSVIGYR